MKVIFDKRAFYKSIDKKDEIEINYFHLKLKEKSRTRNGSFTYGFSLFLSHLPEEISVQKNKMWGIKDYLLLSDDYKFCFDVDEGGIPCIACKGEKTGIVWHIFDENFYFYLRNELYNDLFEKNTKISLNNNGNFCPVVEVENLNKDLKKYLKKYQKERLVLIEDFQEALDEWKEKERLPEEEYLVTLTLPVKAKNKHQAVNRFQELVEEDKWMYVINFDTAVDTGKEKNGEYEEREIDFIKEVMEGDYGF